MKKETHIPDHRHVALVVASVATVGSLYFSLGLGLVPCDLCWYQRILMYPLVLIIGVGILKGDSLEAYVLPMSVAGFAVSTYHNYIQMTPAESPSCTSEVPCSVVQYSIAGVTIPQMSLTAFGIIIGLFLLARIRGW